MLDRSQKFYFKIIFIFSVFTAAHGCSPFNNHVSEVQFASEVPAYPDCTNDNAGSCKITQANKTLLELNLIAANIKVGTTIFGVLESYTGLDLASHQHRNRTTTQVTQYSESITSAGADYTNANPGYRAVPRIALDDDGFIPTSVSYVNRTGWGSTACGTAQLTLNARIADCATVLGANTTWNGAINGNAGQSVWKLVSRTGSVVSSKGREVWQDQRTMLLWSSLLSTSLSWCKASGSNFITGNPTAEDDSSNYCDNSTYQNTTGLAISACYEDGGVSFTTTDAAIDNAGKAGLMRASMPAVAWRLPSKYDYQQADNDGIRFVMPDSGILFSSSEWSSSILSPSRDSAWLFGSGIGNVAYILRNANNSVRCVGR